MKKQLLLSLATLACVSTSAFAERTVTPSESQFYRIKSAYSDFTAEKDMYANGSGIYWGTCAGDDYSALWVFSPVQNENGVATYNMRNAVTGTYVARQPSNSQPFTLTESTSNPVTITQIDGTDQVYITNNRALHAGGWSAGVGSTVLGWQTTADPNSASAWYIESVDTESIEGLRSFYLSEVSKLSAANQAAFADAVSVVNNPASTPTQLVDAYRAIQNKMPEVINFVPVKSESMIQSGNKYVVGVVGTNATAWIPKNPLCYQANEDGNTFGFIAKPNLDFTPDLFWTVNINEEYSCNNTTASHNGPHKVLQLTQDFNGTVKAVKLNATTNKNLAATTDMATNIEFVPLDVPEFSDDYLFQLHVNPSNTSNFRQIHMVSPNGTIGWYTRNAGLWDTNVIGGSNGEANSWSSPHKVYLVLEQDRLPEIAEVIWTMLKEEECAASESDAYKAQVIALALPDVSGFENASTFVEDLRKEFQKALFSLDADLVVTITPGTVRYSSSATAWNSAIVDTQGAFAKIISHSNANETSDLARNITKIDENTFDFRNGQSKSSLYNVECFNPSFRIIGVSFKASSEAAGEYVTVDGEDIHLTAEPQTIISTSSSFVFHGDNQTIKVTDITIKYGRTTNVSAIPSESGWYSVLSAKNLAPYAGMWAVNREMDFRQNANSYYPIGVAEDLSAAPASTLIYIEVNGNNRYIKSANGHYVNENCTSARTRGNVTRFRDYSDVDGTMSVGAYWNSYVVGNDKLIGQGGTASSNRWAVFKENPAELYDIWTVSISGAPNASEIGNDVRVQCTNSANKGISRVYNNGTFFIVKGTSLTAADFVAESSENEEIRPRITVDNTAKTVNVEYLDKQAYLDRVYYPVVDGMYAPYKGIVMFDNEKIDELIAAHRSIIDEAIGEDAIVSDEEIAALDAAIASDRFDDGIKAVRLTAVGKLVQFHNFQHSSFYLSAAPVSDDSDDYRAVGVADRGSNTTIWQIELASEEDGTVYLKNYGTGLWMQNYVRPSANGAGAEADIPVAESDPAPFVLEAYIVGNANTPVIGFKDTQSSNWKYLHQVTNNGNRLVKWHDPASSLASAWTVTSADDDELSAELEFSFPKPEIPGNHMISLGHTDGVSLHDIYSDEHHTIVIKKISAQPLRVQSRAVEASEGDILITPDKLVHDAATNTVSFPINENNQLENGMEYEVQIPAGLVRVGAGKLSKAATTTFISKNNTVVGIDEVEVADSENVNAIYDLQGRRLAAPAKGINFVNGKKVLVK